MFPFVQTASRSVRAATLALAILLAVTTLPLAANAQGAATGPLLDFAALVLQPADLEAEGLPGFGTDYSQTFTTKAEMLHADRVFDSRLWMVPENMPNAGAVLTASGWMRFHELMLATPRPEDPLLFNTVVASSSTPPLRERRWASRPSPPRRRSP